MRYVKASLGNPTQLYQEPVWGRRVIQSWKMKQKWKCSRRSLGRILLWKQTLRNTPACFHWFLPWDTVMCWWHAGVLSCPFLTMTGRPGSSQWCWPNLLSLLGRHLDLRNTHLQFPCCVIKHIMVQATNCVFWYLLPKYPDSFRL